MITIFQSNLEIFYQSHIRLILISAVYLANQINGLIIIPNIFIWTLTKSCKRWVEKTTFSTYPSHSRNYLIMCLLECIAKFQTIIFQKAVLRWGKRKDSLGAEETLLLHRAEEKTLITLVVSLPHRANLWMKKCRMLV